MIVNMGVDHLMSPRPESAEQVWHDTSIHAKLWTDAAARIGLTPAEYRQFRKDLLDGKVVFVRLPHHLDAMSGDRRGSVYAVKNAFMQDPGMGWKVVLADGNLVYVPQTCGNISMLRGKPPLPPVACKGRSCHRVRPLAYVPSIVEVPVTVVPPPQPEQTPTIVSPVVPAAAPVQPFPWYIPAAVGGVIAGFIHGTPASVPPCRQGSNGMSVCSK